MKLRNIFNKKSNKIIQPEEVKTQAAAGFNPLISPLFYADGEKPILYTSEAILYMMECAPVWTALHRIAEGVASIQPKVRNKKTGEFVEHEVLDLLSRPDADITFGEFMKNCAEWYMGTGNVYIEGKGYIDKLPYSMRVMPSYSTTVTPAGDGYVDTMITRLLMISNVYKRKEVVEYGRPRYRYYAEDAPELRELYQIRTFNPQVGSNMVYGLSPLNAVFYEMRQYIESAKSNMSSLSRSARLSGIFKYAGVATDQQKQQLQSQVSTVYAGGQNAGRNIVIDKNWDYEDLLKAARDMDYLNTSKHTAEVIYKALGIPLPLVNPENMTYSNYEIAQYAFYKDCVIPLRKKLDQELTLFLMPRCEKEDLFEICFNPRDIPQLEPERNQQMKLRKEAGIYTINELRTEDELEPLDGGQYIYGTMGTTPIATDDNDQYAGTGTYSQEEIANRSNEQAQIQQESDDEKQKQLTKVAKEEFVTRLKRQVNKDGTPRFTEDDIKELADKHYGIE